MSLQSIGSWHWLRRRRPWLAAALVACCGERPLRHAQTPTAASVPQAAAAEHRPPAVVLFAIDGVRWQEVFYGTDPKRSKRVRVTSSAELMPNLHTLMHASGAVLGAPGFAAQMRASGPNYVSLPGYVEILTGRPAVCTNNSCPRVDAPTLLDQFAARPGAELGDVAAIGSWPTLEQAVAKNPDRVVISVGRLAVSNPSFLLDDPTLATLLRAGTDAGPRPGYGAFRADRHTAALGMAYLERLRPDFLFLGLGESDEYAHHNDYPGYIGALEHADSVLGKVVAILDEIAQSGRETLLIVTTDHGRAKNFVAHGGAHPEAARTWLVAGGTLVRARGWVKPREPRYLADVAPTIRALTNLEADSERGAGRILEELFGPGAESPAPVARY